MRLREREAKYANTVLLLIIIIILKASLTLVKPKEPVGFVADSTKDQNIGKHGYIGNWILRKYRKYRKYQ